MKTNILTNKPLAILILLAGLVFKTYGQNLPSLLTEKNINATFSILAYDEKAQEWGIAVATNNIYVGNSTIYIEPGVGAFSVIAETEPLYAYNGLKALKMGKSIQEAIEQTKQNDKEHFLRQVSGIDATGNVYAFTGSALKYWQGNSNHKLGYRFVVIGNQLANNVLETMHRTFIATQGTLAERLLKSLIAGQQSGGQVQGKQSAALVVKGTQNEWFNNIDLRVDNAREPFNELQKLLNYHYGRIRINQAVYAIRSQNTTRGKVLLAQAKTMLAGWNGIYSKIAMAHLLLGEEKEATAYIKKGLAENPAWKENLPAFYLLRTNPAIKGLINDKTFTEKDWASALSMLLNLGQNNKAHQLSDRVLQQYPTSLHYFLSARIYSNLGNKQMAITQLEKAMQLDADNQEAILLFKQLAPNK